MNYQPHKTSAVEAEQLNEIVDEMRRLWHRMTRGWSSQPELHGLQRQQYWVLAALARGPKRMSELAECTQTSQASLTGIVDRMVEHGLVDRLRSSEDRRVVEVAATDTGRELLDVAYGVMVSGISDVAEPLTDVERSEFLRLMRKLNRRDS
ncbi:MAG TPA: MarR family transcriptional regulator [Coriobacteriia bacterium]|nr:MarR family transcriptional regulator [Coriobacteriia bacterium]